MNKTINFNLVSRYRSELMGVAILWVMFFHLVAKGPLIFNFSVLSPILGIGYGGVDIFLFLSGLGLYFSFRKSINLKSFYIRRVIRILPTYIVVNIVYGILSKMSILDIFYNITTIGYWLNTSYYDWYIPAILMLYLFFPLLYKAIESFPVIFILSISSISCLMIIVSLYFTHFQLDDIRFFFIARVPIFVVGIYMGKLINENKINLAYISWLFMCVGLILLYFVKQHTMWFKLGSGVQQIPFVLITPGLCLLCAVIFNVISLIFCRFFSFCGRLSLELYLVHLHLFSALPFYPKSHKLLYVCGLFCISFILAYILHRTILYVTAYFQRILSHEK